ncbi:MAG TPA: DUF6152 family protein [Caulobacteraceae bacterium]|jgi:hypothetical protein|nr:DUF6152 family protein [Caulobacteraceae bacterium]
MKEMRAMFLPSMLGLTVALGAVAGPAFAHHSFVMYDKAKTATISGTVKSWQFANPHSELVVSVVENGVSSDYTVEGSSVNVLVRIGWGPHSFNPGDKITVVMNPMRDGSKAGSFLRATLENGKTLSAGSQATVN